MTFIPSESDRSFRTRALEALQEEALDASARSCFAQDARFCLFASSAIEDEGIEFLLEFPLSSRAGTTSSLDMPFELRSDGRSIFEGTWHTAATLDGQFLRPVGSWETNCVAPSKTYAFCERSIAMTGGGRFSRRVCLAYHESMLIVADELTPAPRERKRPRPRALRSLTPLAPEANVRANDETRELLLVSSDSGETIARVFPMTLPEWRADSSQGEFCASDSCAALELATTSQGASLFSALIFDFNLRRAARRCSWRPLTVGENRSPALKDDAFGGKLQLGSEQYVLYASTSEKPAIRSILSRRLLSDFMFGKFLTSRGVVPILDFEVDEAE